MTSDANEASAVVIQSEDGRVGIIVGHHGLRQGIRVRVDPVAARYDIMQEDEAVFTMGGAYQQALDMLTSVETVLVMEKHSVGDRMRMFPGVAVTVASSASPG